MAHLTLGLLEFTWDDKKASANFKKHGVSFAEAATAFLDNFAEMIEDIEHSEEEDRILLLATSLRRKILMVVHVARGRQFRIISARPATPRESRRYEKTRTGER